MIPLCGTYFCRSAGNDRSGFTAASAQVVCSGANACKGQGSCKSASNACKGQNACKGKSFITTGSTIECTAIKSR